MLTLHREVRLAGSGLGVTLLVALVVVVSTGRGDLVTWDLLCPVDAVVQITHKLVAKLGTVRVVYTGGYLQIPLISRASGKIFL